MNKPIIEIKNISKMYHLGETIQYNTIRDKIADWVKDSFGKKCKEKHKIKNKEKDILWALDDISFNVNQGEVVGIIGRNGAGKSTLLKILSRITSPTKGKIIIRGRCASLLEVGTGFSAELTGRENIYLNGSILGMMKKEIDKKFDEIVAFAEVEKFIDTPLKRYSSGMYVRLAFAVAAHLEPDILLVDEVLAVGDIAFQKKCLGKMEDVSKKGRTVIFVSHNMATISSLCHRGIVLEKGQIIINESIEKAIQVYISSISDKVSKKISMRKDRKGIGKLRFTDVWIENEHNEHTDIVCSGETIQFIIKFKLQEKIKNTDNLVIAIYLENIMGIGITDLWSESAGIYWDNIPETGYIICTLPKLPLNTDIYRFNIIARINNIIQDWIINAGEFTVEAGDFWGSGKIPPKNQGIFLFSQEWKLLSN